MIANIYKSLLVEESFLVIWN